MATNMNIRLPDRRERLYDELTEATGESSRSKALDRAAQFYCIMLGGNAYAPGDGNVGELMQAAIERGSLTPEEIAACLDCDPVPVTYDVQRRLQIGQSDE